jgi:ketosteroid isomerase-like protein
MGDHDNIRIVREGFEDFKKGDLATLLSKFAPDIVWVNPGPSELPLAGKKQGHAQVAEHFKKLHELVELTQFEPKEFTGHGDMVAVFGHSEGKVRATGKSFSDDWAMSFRMKDGKVTHHVQYNDTAALVKAFAGSK